MKFKNFVRECEFADWVESFCAWLLLAVVQQCQTPFFEWCVVLDCWREDACRFKWQTSLVFCRVWFLGLGPATTHLVQSWNDMQVAERATTPREDWILVLQADQNWFSSAQTLHLDSMNAIGTNVCFHTMRHRLHDINLRARRPYIYIQLTLDRNSDNDNWLGPKSCELLLTGPLYCLLMSPEFVWTTLMVVLECGAGQEKGTRMPASFSMTIMAEGHW
jgi:hypothetical protein